MLLEKVSVHTEILFVYCYKFLLFICSFSVFVENCILLPKAINEMCCVPAYCTCMVLIFLLFTQNFIRDNFSRANILLQSAFLFSVTKM